MEKRRNHELFYRYSGNPILSVKDWPYDANSVFNAAAAELKGETLLLVRVEDFRGISLSAPPIETEEGWLLLYHGVRSTASGSIYSLGMALLDIEEPRRTIRRTNEWIFGPKASYEREGDVDDVVFPCGWIKKDDKVLMYYGAADSCIGLATASVKELLEFMLKCPEGDER